MIPGFAENPVSWGAEAGACKPDANPSGLQVDGLFDAY